MNDATLNRLAGAIQAYVETKRPPEGVLAEVQAMFMAAASPYATTPEAAAYCRVSVSTLNEAAAAGLIQKCYPAGTASVRYRKSDLDKWLTSGRAPRNRRGPKGNNASTSNNRIRAVVSP